MFPRKKRMSFFTAHVIILTRFGKQFLWERYLSLVIAFLGTCLRQHRWNMPRHLVWSELFWLMTPYLCIWTISPLILPIQCWVAVINSPLLGFIRMLNLWNLRHSHHVLQNWMQYVIHLGMSLTDDCQQVYHCEGSISQSSFHRPQKQKATCLFSITISAKQLSLLLW